MATHAGIEGEIKIAAATIAEVNGYSWTQTAEPVEDTELSDEWRSYKGGTSAVKGWTGDIDCHWDETDTTGQGAMTIGAEVTVFFYPEGSASGATYYTGSAIVINNTGNGGKGSTVTASYSLQGNGAMTSAVVA